MSRRDYPRLSVEDFGHQLIVSGDLDPVYVMLHGARLEEPQLARWLTAYWCLYHCGAASLLSEREGTAFWDGLAAAAHNQEPTPLGGRWPRGHERRHFRGAQGTEAVHELRAEYGSRSEGLVEGLVRLFNGGSSVPFTEVAEAVQRHRGFGPWMAFKVADMLERVLGIPVDFNNAAVFMFKDPVKAALMVWRQRMKLPEFAQPKDLPATLNAVVSSLENSFSHLTAPPARDRAVGIQEVETVLCKWKSHVNGHYPLWNDTDEIGAGLTEWAAVSETAALLRGHLPSKEIA